MVGSETLGAFHIDLKNDGVPRTNVRIVSLEAARAFEETLYMAEHPFASREDFLAHWAIYGEEVIEHEAILLQDADAQQR